MIISEKEFKKIKSKYIIIEDKKVKVFYIKSQVNYFFFKLYSYITISVCPECISNLYFNDIIRTMEYIEEVENKIIKKIISFKYLNSIEYKIIFHD
jgi:hypothetical protein